MSELTVTARPRYRMSEAMTRTRVHTTAAVGRARTRLGRWWPTRWPWWVATLVVYGAGRVVSAVIIMAVAAHQEQNYWTPASPSYSQYVGRMWDSTWYWNIYDHGYPSTLPVGPDGLVQQNEWAFYPLFPFTVRLLHAATGLSWNALAPTLSLACGAGAAVLIYRLVATCGARATARRPGLPLATVALVTTFPAAPVLQVAYTESIALLLITATLYLIYRRRYEWAALSVLLLGFSRAIALPIALVVIWHVIMRWRREGRPATVDLVRTGALFLVSIVAGFVWQIICGLVTGVPDAYNQTQSTWRSGEPVVPIKPWFEVAKILWGSSGIWILLAILIAVTAMVVNPVAARLGPELQSWAAAYVLYLFGVIYPWTSLGRFMLLAFPLGAIAVAWTRSRLWLWFLIVAGVVGQVFWVSQLWRLVMPSGFPP